MMKISTMIVDDELPARQRIAGLLRKANDIEIVAECANGDEALGPLLSGKVRLLFLDIQMPRMSGFELLQKLDPGRIPLTIFVTAFDQYAVQAFEIHALDYLLKPFREERFKLALDRARMQLSQKLDFGKQFAAFMAEQPWQPSKARIAVRTPERVHLVRIEEIDWLESARNYIVLHAGKETHVIRDTLSAVEQQLPPGKFVRISRSAIVNIDRVQELERSGARDYLVVLRTGAKLPASMALKELQQRLGVSF